jgi:SAM-dependent methyltransferase
MTSHDYKWESAGPTGTAAYLWPSILGICQNIGARRILDLGCGNGALAAYLSAKGFAVEGTDSSKDGIRIAKAAHPHIRFHVLAMDGDTQSLGTFDTVISTEVIEHLYLPRQLPRFARHVLSPRGHLIISTPYHGFLKNLVLSVANKWDHHHGPLWDGGHIKFWSRNTLTQLLHEEGFVVTGFRGVGRIHYLWKSMLIVAVSPVISGTLHP